MKQERTNWRDQALSNRHHLWGELPFVDFDFCGLNFDHEQPRLEIEYKHCRARVPDLADAKIRAIANYCDGKFEPMPFVIGIYDPRKWVFRGIPVNDKAKQACGPWMNRYLTEQQWVTMLHLLTRGYIKKADQEIISGLSDYMPRFFV